MMNFIMLIATLLPTIILGLYIYFKDKNREPKKLLFKLFIGGFLAVVLTVIINIILGDVSYVFSSDYDNLNMKELLVNVFISVALVEEGAKFLFLYILSFNSKEYDEKYDMIVYSTFIALGFATLENLCYVFQSGDLTVALLRGVTAVPVHLCCGIIMGSYLSRAKCFIENTKKYVSSMILSFVCPFIIHGIYDYCLLSKSVILLVLLVIFVILIYIVSFHMVSIYAHDDTVIKERD